MIVNVIKEVGFDEAMFGLSLNKNQPTENMPNVAKKLSKLGNGHNNFLEMIMIYLQINAPRYWWQQFDRYRLCSRQSQSTMHTILKRPLTQDDFSELVSPVIISDLNALIEKKDLDAVKANLPEGFLQRRVVMLSYKTLRNIIEQRRKHKLKEWEIFIRSLCYQLKYPEFINDLLIVKEGDLP